MLRAEPRKPNSGLKAVVFDWAGTTVDYGCLAPVAAFVEVFRQLGVEITLQEARAPMGLMKKDHIREITEMPSVRGRWCRTRGAEPTEADVQVLYESLEPMLIETVAAYSVPVPGIVELCSVLRQRGIVVGSSTGYSAPTMQKLAAAAAEKGFRADVVVSSSDVPSGRPDPWMCHVNAMRLKVYPMRSMVKIGDTVADIGEGLNAGMWTVGVVTSGNLLGLSEEQQRLSDPGEVAGRIAAGYRELLQAGAHYVIDGVWEALPVLEEIDQRLRAGECP